MKKNLTPSADKKPPFSMKKGGIISFFQDIYLGIYWKERLIEKCLFLGAISAVMAVFFIIIFLVRDGYQIFLDTGSDKFLLGSFWNPTGEPATFGAFPLIVGTVLVTIGAMAISIPLSLGSALYIAEIASPRIKSIVKPAIELLAGIPSVVYGFFGLVLLTNWIRIGFDQPSGSSWLAGSILLGIMALPTITSVAEDAISAVPREFKEGSLALGANHWQTIRRVIIPGALSGITAAIILGIGRAIGETMAVLMVTGNAAIIPEPLYNVFSPIRTLTGTLGIEMGEVAFGSIHYHALFGVAVILLFITLVVNISAILIINRIRKVQAPSQAFSLYNVIPRSDILRSMVRIPWLLIRLIGTYLNESRFMRFLGRTILKNIRPIIHGVLKFIASIVLGIHSIFIIRQIRRRLFHPQTSQKMAFSLLTLSVLIILFILGIILSQIIINGSSALSWEFLTQSPRDLGRSGGIFPAIVGTLYLVGGALLVAFPLGIASAVYLIEYTKESRFTDIIRTGIDLLNGTPSIVFGLFGFAFLVLFLNFGISLLAGQITLGLMILPTIIRTTEEALQSIPKSIREGSYALGATKWQTTWRVVLPPAIPGILTGTILSIGRATGETAPIMFTAVVFNSKYLPTSVFDPVMALPYHLFILTTTVPDATDNKFGTALILVLTVLSIYLIAILLRQRYQVGRVV